MATIARGRAIVGNGTGKEEAVTMQIDSVEHDGLLVLRRNSSSILNVVENSERIFLIFSQKLSASSAPCHDFVLPCEKRRYFG